MFNVISELFKYTVKPITINEKGEMKGYNSYKSKETSTIAFIKYYVNVNQMFAKFVGSAANWLIMEHYWKKAFAFCFTDLGTNCYNLDQLRFSVLLEVSSQNSFQITLSHI